ncbi:MAG: hypothetical protein JW795_01810 [Chitinivibrionales bacterium]|nr:hypothetical protein [Chitinivibrionales bacterium]
MEKKLTIGLLQLTPTWQALCEQLGVQYGCVQLRQTTLCASDYSVLIVNKTINRYEIDMIKHYVNTGGAVIDFGFCITHFFSGTLSQRTCSTIVADDAPFEPHLGCIDIHDTVTLYSKAQYWDQTLFFNTYGSGIACFCGINIEKALLNTESKRIQFYASTPRFPNEETSTVTKGELCRALCAILRSLHIRRHLPFVHKWYFPRTASNVVLFRVDSDYGSQHQIRQWHDAAQKAGLVFTWFLHVKAHEPWLSLFSSFTQDEIAVHGYDHFFSPKLEKNRQNIAAAIEILARHGYQCRGYASPYGLWNKALQTMCEQLDFRYSSEFSFLYDSLPLNPVIDNRLSSIIQIPIHPICISTLLQAKASDDQMLTYFSETIQWHRSHCIPLAFYDHVLHDRTEVLEKLLARLAAADGLPMVFSDYAQFWKRRCQNSWQVTFNDTHNYLNINLSQHYSDGFLAVWLSDTTYVLAPPKNGRFKIDDGQKLTRHGTPKRNLQLQRESRRVGFRLFKQSLLTKTFWRKTR